MWENNRERREGKWIETGDKEWMRKWGLILFFRSSVCDSHILSSNARTARTSVKHVINQWTEMLDFSLYILFCFHDFAHTIYLLQMCPFPNLCASKSYLILKSGSMTTHFTEPFWLISIPEELSMEYPIILHLKMLVTCNLSSKCSKYFRVLLCL